MKITNAIKKIEKAGYTAEKINDSNNYKAEANGYVLEFMENGKSGEITCISLRAKSNKPDAMTDYFPYTWYDNLTQALKALNNK